MLRIDNLTYRIGDRVLFDRASAVVNAGQRVGFVGRNGTGKTTLLRLITGALEPENGTISVSGRWRIGMTSQEAPSGSRNPVEAVLAADHELTALQREAATTTDHARIVEIHERLRDKEAHSAPARAARILDGLGFDHAAQLRPLDTFSGGWRMRVMLAALLFTQPDLLLLDEPTNHLDLESTLWLEECLRRYSGTVLVVSHERDLLNSVAQKILHLEHHQLKLYQGGYDRFERTRRMQLARDAKLRTRQEAQRAHIEKFVARFRYKATKARQAQSRLKMLERMEPIPEHQNEASVTFQFPDPKLLAPPLFSARDVSVGYDDTPVLKRLSLYLDDDDRVALLGANGNGKSTLIRLLARRLLPMEGTVAAAPKLRVGYFAQHQTDELDLAGTPVSELARRRPGDSTEQIRSQLARFGFSQDRALTIVASLSGGEKARLLFALMTADRPHILLLDEPTNHLDVDSRQALIQAINAFAGAVVIVSHDPHVIKLTANRFWLVAGGTVAPFDGDLQDYRELLLAGSGNGKRADTGTEGAPSLPPKSRRAQRRRAAAQRRALAPLRRDLETAERMVEELTARKAGLDGGMAGPGLDDDGSKKAIALRRELREVNREMAEDEARGLQLQEQWETAQAA
ncbi:MAG: ABC-F family ATP-binding cassette domain-containing protein [Gammaproteobacteria bacterium]|nr:ABC-F family ATP-binding cassette domain-containing protein [Gammaproteobacteria bacterium]